MRGLGLSREGHGCPRVSGPEMGTEAQVRWSQAPSQKPHVPHWPGPLLGQLPRSLFALINGLTGR